MHGARMIYQYSDKNGHIAERFRKMDNRHDPLDCSECGEPMHLIISRPHVPPDGVYSYAPNIGSADAFERKRSTIERNRERKKDGLRPLPAEKSE